MYFIRKDVQTMNKLVTNPADGEIILRVTLIWVLLGVSNFRIYGGVVTAFFAWGVPFCVACGGLMMPDVGTCGPGCGAFLAERCNLL